MQLNKDYKLERFDKLNVALFRKMGKKKKHWKSFRYYPTWYKAIKDAMTYLSLDTISGSGDCSDIIVELKRIESTIECIADRLSREGAENGQKQVY